MKSSPIRLPLAHVLDKLRQFPAKVQTARHLQESGERSSALNTSPKDGFVFVSEPDGEAARRYRHIVDEMLGRVWARKRMLVTSPDAGEGKTVTSVNLALALAEKRFTVFLVELALMRPRYRFVFGAPPSSVGVESVLRGEVAPSDAIFQLGDTRVAVASVGAPMQNDDLLRRRGNLQRLLEFGDSVCDWTVLDAPSVNGCPAVADMAAQAGPVVMVARSRATRLEAFRAAAKTLGSKLDYVILNDAAS